MIQVAFLDDNSEDRKLLAEYLKTFQKEQKLDMEIFSYSNSLDFLENYTGTFDVIMLDVEMPGMDGMEVAKEIRRVGGNEGILFITNMEYAIRGYEVGAIDFIVKPVQYFYFAEKFQKVLEFVDKRQHEDVLLNHEDEIVRISLYDILYVDKDRNYLIYHTKQGKFRERGTIQKAKIKLGEQMFAECSSGCLVNLRYVERVGRNRVILSGEELPVSRGMRQQFLQKFMEYAGGGC